MKEIELDDRRVLLHVKKQTIRSDLTSLSILDLGYSR